MATVPYNPVPDVAQETVPTSPERVQTSPEMFGGSIGTALSTLGRVGEQAGDEIFARAVAMQQLNNEAEARQADADYMQKAGELHATFSSLQGKAAVDAYPNYVQSLRDARDDIGSDLSNPAAQKLYDQSSLPTYGRTVFNGAGHAAEQLKAYSAGTASSHLQAANDQVLSSPDERTFQASLAASEQSVRQLGDIHGEDRDTIEQNVAVTRSKLYATRIESITQQLPMVGKKMLTEALEKGDIRGEDIARVQSVVDKAVMSSGSRTNSDAINNGTSWELGNKVVDIERAKDAVGWNESGNNYDRRGPLVTKGQYKGQQALGRYGVMPGNLPSWLAQTGLPPMTPEEFLKDHPAQDRVFQTVFGKMMSDNGSFNEAISRWFTGRSIKDAIDAGANDDHTTIGEYLNRNNARLAKSASLQEKVSAGENIARSQAPDMPLLQDATRQRIMADHEQQKKIEQDQLNADKNTIDTALLGPKVPANLDQLKATSPDVAAAVERMNPQQQLALQAKIRTAYANDDTPSQERSNNMNKMLGLYHNDPAQFQDTHLFDVDLTATDRKRLNSLQGELIKGGTADPHVSRAMKWLEPDLNAAGIKNEKDNNDDYIKFTGALAQQIDAYQKDNNRAPNQKETLEMGRRLLQDQATPRLGGWLGTSHEHLFQVSPPDDIKQKIIHHPSWNGRTPSDVEIQQVYTKALYDQLYKKK